jgi:hypothetical protein
LKDFTRDLYYYEENDWLDNVFVYLDKVLMCNQYITNAFTEILKGEIGAAEFYDAYPKGLFPQFLYDYDQEIIKEYTDRINEEIEEIPAMLIEGGDFVNAVMSLTSMDKFDLLDLREPYSKIISIMKYHKDPLLERAEYGYYIGSLLKIKADEWLEKYGETIFVEPDWDVLNNRVERFRKGVFCRLDELEEKK